MLLYLQAGLVAPGGHRADMAQQSTETTQELVRVTEQHCQNSAKAADSQTVCKRAKDS